MICFRKSVKKVKTIEKAYVIAELGTAHQGDIKLAEELIIAAKKAGADCAKFQIVFADEIVHPNVGDIILPGGKTNIYQSFKNVEQDREFYEDLQVICKKNNIDILFSVFGTKSLELAQNLGSNKIKIASPELNYYSLLKKASTSPLILSTGVSTQKDISNAIKYLKSLNTDPYCLMQCVTQYPAEEASFNLRILPLLAKKYNTTIGISDHSSHPWLIPVLAACQGAIVVEKHFTLSNLGKGLDDKIALTPENFALMVEKLRSIENANPKEILKNLKKEFGRKRIRAALGKKRKSLTASEKKIYKTTNRSFVAIDNIKRGSTITAKSGSFLRAETNHEAGITEDKINKLIGRKAKIDIQAGSGINFKNTKQA